MTDWRARMRQALRADLPLVALGGVTVAVYRAGLQYNDTISHFLSLALLQVALYLVAAWIILRSRDSRSTLLIVLIFATVFRLSILFAPPHLSTDIYRYIWDGRVQAAGINPYRYAPADKALAPLRDKAIYPAINRREYAHTIYPPLAQFIYLAVTRVSETVTWMKAALVGFEAVTLWALAALLATFGLPRQRVLLYAWHPLIVWEIAGSGHVDAAAIAFVALALLARRHNWERATGSALACAALIKLYPLALLPALFRRWRWRMPAAFLVTCLLAYLPYLSVGAQGALGFLPGYADEEGLRSGSRFFILNFLRRLFGAHRVPTAIYVGFALAVLALLAARAVFRQGREPRSYITSNLALGAAFTILLSPQYPWYFTWLVPFLCFAVSSAWLPLFYLTTACFVLYRLWLDYQPGHVFAVNAWLYLPTALLGACAVWLRHSAFSRSESTEASGSRPKENRFEEAARDAPVLAEARVTVVIPALNEEATIADVVRAVPPELAAEVIVVDNGSDDRTAERARLAGARVVAEPRRGYGRACQAGVRALDPACGIVVFLDGDGSDCPELMNELIRPIAQGDYDFVIGSRTRGRREKGSMSFQQIFAGRVAGWLLRLLYGARYTDMCPFRAIRRAALDDLGMREETYGWNLEMQMRAARAGLRILELPVEHRCRAGGESKVSGTLRGTLLAGTRIVATLIRVAAERDRGRFYTAQERKTRK